MIFDEEKVGTRQVVPNCFRTPIPKFHFLMFLFNLVLGLRKFYRNQFLTFFYFLILHHGGRGMYFFKAKNVEKLLNRKTIFPILGAYKIVKQLLISIFLFVELKLCRAPRDRG